MVELLNLYNAIPAEDRKTLRSKIAIKNFKKGDFLLLDGEVQNELYLVKSGTLMMYFDTDEKVKVVDFAYLNRFCVDIDSFSNQTPSVYCIRCIDDCVVETIEYESLQTVFDQSPQIERAYRLLLESVLSAVIRKELNQGIMTIQQRFNKIIEKRPELFSLVPHKYIASYINIDPTNFSKLYNRIQNTLKYG